MHWFLQLTRIALQRTEPNLSTLGAIVGKRYAGHSKWANIRHIKGLKDAQRSQVFNRIARLMKIAIQEGKSANPQLNFQLQQALEQAKRANMPNATIQNILKTSHNKTEGKKYLLEIRGPNGTFILLEVFTDNFPRVKQILSPILRKSNAQLADGGCKHLFDYKGIIDCQVPNDLISKSDDAVTEICTEHAIIAGAEDTEIVESTNDKKIVRFLCDPNTIDQIAKSLASQFQYTIQSKCVEYIPNQCIEMADTEYQNYEKLYEKLQSIPEVINIYDNVTYTGQ